MSGHGTLTQPDPSRVPDAPGPAKIAGRVRLAGYAVGGVVVAVGLATLGLWLASAMTGGNDSVAAATWQRPVVSDSGLVDQSGVRITQVAVTGGGGLIDVRFRVVDPEKADAIHDEATPPALVDAETGVVVDQLLMGHKHSDPFQAGQTYYLIFENPLNLVQHGSKVSVLLGDAQVDGVEVW